MRLCPTCRAEYDDAPRYCPQDGAKLVPLGHRSATVAMYDGLIGETLEERYRVQGRLGEGSLAVVYSGLHVLIEKEVAIKVLKADFLGDESITKRFVQEARAASRLDHSNIVSISDFGRTPQGSPFFVMERLVGPTLGDLLEDGKPLPLRRALAITRGIGAGLAEAHRQGIVHRDVKPDNILIVRGSTGEEMVKLVDFGLAQVTHEAARLTRSGQVLGTPAHMAPEQAAGKPVDGRADLFALGILVYRMLSGRLPFAGKSTVEVLHRLMDATPDPLPPQSIDGRPLAPLWPVVRQALAREPEDRPADVDTFLTMLSQVETAPSHQHTREAPHAATPSLHLGSVTQENQIALEILSRTQSRQIRRRRSLWVLFAALLAVMAGLIVGHRLLSAQPSESSALSRQDPIQGPRELSSGAVGCGHPSHECRR